MKVLYIGHFHEGSGWTEAAVNNALALNSVGVDVVCRSLRLGRGILDSRVEKLVEKDAIGANVNIQHILPEYYEYDASYKNIAYFDGETYNLKNQPSNWYSKLKMMDEVWLSNDKNRSELPGSKVVGHPVDSSKYLNQDKLSIPQLAGNYVFYTIADANRRKNTLDLIRAFHTEFSRNEPVSLLLKLSYGNTNNNDFMRGLSEEINGIKSKLKIHYDISRYIPEVIISDRLSDQEMIAVHNTCDCYVNPSHGEGWNLPLFDAWAIGNRIISPFADYPYYSVNSIGWTKLSTTEDSIFDYETIPYIGTAREQWDTINVLELQRAMRNAYNAGPKKYHRDVTPFLYKTIGEKMKELING